MMHRRTLWMAQPTQDDQRRQRAEQKAGDAKILGIAKKRLGFYILLPVNIWTLFNILKYIQTLWSYFVGAIIYSTLQKTTEFQLINTSQGVLSATISNGCSWTSSGGFSSRVPICEGFNVTAQPLNVSAALNISDPDIQALYYSGQGGASLFNLDIFAYALVVSWVMFHAAIWNARNPMRSPSFIHSSRALAISLLMLENLLMWRTDIVADACAKGCNQGQYALPGVAPFSMESDFEIPFYARSFIGFALLTIFISAEVMLVGAPVRMALDVFRDRSDEDVTVLNVLRAGGRRLCGLFKSPDLSENSQDQDADLDPLLGDAPSQRVILR